MLEGLHSLNRLLLAEGLGLHRLHWLSWSPRLGASSNACGDDLSSDSSPACESACSNSA